ncbi:MAG: hypothetical protein ABS81_05655 [Pseudonocardia sp. SCN 72-86]|nr:MAG: hypothetical protein ABS81_05655 [Pseudonocardia sp. SCN 72-86]
MDMLIASYVATMFALTLANERSNTDLGLRYRGGVVESLVAGQFVDTDDARRKVEALGFEASEALQVAVLRVAPKGAAPFADIADRRAEDLQAAIVRKLPRAAVTLRRHELIVLHGSDRTEDMRPADEMLPALERLAGSTETGSVLVAGVSEFGHRPTDIPRLYTEACHAVETSNLVPGLGRIVAYSGIGIYRLLLQVGDGRELTRFAESVLGPLLQYDASHKLGLIQTLAVYLNQRESLKQAARRLHVHTNTVTYRLQRIEQLTNLALSDPDDRLMAHVAVKILELKRRDAESGRRRRGGVPASELEHYAVY